MGSYKIRQKPGLDELFFKLGPWLESLNRPILSLNYLIEGFTTNLTKAQRELDEEI